MYLQSSAVHISAQIPVIIPVYTYLGLVIVFKIVFVLFIFVLQCTVKTEMEKRRVGVTVINQIIVLKAEFKTLMTCTLQYC